MSQRLPSQEEEACQTLDAALFSGDPCPDDLNRLDYFLRRWQARVQELRGRARLDEIRAESFPTTRLGQVHYLLALIEAIERIFESGLDWEVKFNEIFSDHGSKRILTVVADQGFSFDWYDPDTTYEADVTAFVQALQEYRDERLIPLRDEL